MTFEAWHHDRRLNPTKLTHAAASIGIYRDRSSQDEFGFELRALCDAAGYETTLDLTRDDAVTCTACMAKAGVR